MLNIKEKKKENHNMSPFSPFGVIQVFSEEAAVRFFLKQWR